jgi:hypothetical protein
MLLCLQVLCIALIISNFIAVTYIGQVFQIDFTKVPWRAVGILLLLLVLVCYGVQANDPRFLLSLKPFVSVHLFSRSIPLSLVCIALSMLLTVLLIAGVCSETIILEPDCELDLKIYKVRGSNEAVLGYGSRTKPFSKRFLSGNLVLRFESPGFESESRLIHVRKSKLSSEGRREIIALHASPIFAFHSYYYFPERIDHEHYQGPQYPKYLEKYPGSAINFTIGCISLPEIRIQDVFIYVEQAQNLMHATFPAYEMGNGATPIEGWVELKPECALFRILTAKKPKVGTGIDPSDFHIHAFCSQPYTFTIRVEIDWIDPRHQSDVRRKAFDEKLDLPLVIEWEALARKAGYLKILFDDQATFLADDLDSMAKGSEYTILFPVLAGSPRGQIDRRGVVMISLKARQRILEALAATQIETPQERPLRFMILNGQSLLIERQPGSGVLVQNPQLIKEVEAIFDDVVAESQQNDQENDSPR